ncbi:phosphotriesterase-related protein [Paenibacillus sp. HWE-109]|uniref:phosphotriesterase family protein n=1 Tax=Paenibacillus sp. HWE-109 TaxID=1306526 RepID=UPI001EDDB443|nr:phosphotriesterase-related protein [Paenibacillus sp. HWE-109]UKS24819.1 phosphotriesterase-related protein [Paenibacillus sp. HWE-109]
MKLHTVRGLMDASAIGSTMIHEHLVFDLTGVRQDTDSRLQSTDVIEEIAELKAAGCSLVVEVSNIGMGRNPLEMLEIAERTGIAIVASTGFYKECFYPPFVFESSSESLAEIFVQDIEEGMDGTSIKAGLIAEIGSSLNEITAAEEKVFRAAILAHRTTGASISTHCEIGTMGKQQLALFDQYGADLSRISFGHQDLNLDMDEQMMLVKSGAFIQFDTVGKLSYRSDEDRAVNLVRLLEAGFEDKLMLSCDITRKSHLRHYGGHGYHHLFESFLPLLEKYGVTDPMLFKMLVENPRKFLAF